MLVCIGNSMICSDVWHKYLEWYFEIVIRSERHISKLLYVVKGSWNLRQFWNITSGIYANCHVQIMLLFVYTSTHKRFVIFTCRYFKLRWNNTALSQSYCRNFSCSSISMDNNKICSDMFHPLLCSSGFCRSLWFFSSYS